MVAEESLQGEHATATVLPCPGRPAQLREGAGAILDGGVDVAVGHDPAVAHDHASKANLTKAYL
jgi:hypothetical protein